MMRFLRSDKMFYLLFFSTLTGTAFGGYVYSILFVICCFLTKERKKITPFGLLFFILYILLIICKISQTDNPNLVSVITRFYLGVGPILLYVYYSRVKININLLIILLSSEVLLESLLINFFISPTILPNYPTEIKLGGFDAAEVIGYQRPYSVGINSTVTATILCMMLAYREMQIKCGKNSDLKTDILSALAVLALASGTGFLLYIIYLLYRFSDSISIKSIISVGCLSLFLFIIVTNLGFMEETLVSHFSKDYIDFMIDYKGEVTEDYFKLFNNKLLGLDFYKMAPLTHGDTAWVEFLLSFGISGVVYFLCLIKHFVNRLNWCPILIGLIGALHYGGIFSLPGQLILAYSMVLGVKTRCYYFND